MVEEIAAERNIPIVELIRGLAQAGLRAIRDHQIELKSVGDQIRFERSTPAAQPREAFSIMEDKPLRKPKGPQDKSFLPPNPP